MIDKYTCEHSASGFCRNCARNAVIDYEAACDQSLEYCKEYEAKLQAANARADALQQQADDMRIASQRTAEANQRVLANREATIKDLSAKLDAALADNAALHDAVMECHTDYNDMAPSRCYHCQRRLGRDHEPDCIVVKEHPGTTLLAELTELRTRVVELESAKNSAGNVIMMPLEGIKAYALVKRQKASISELRRRAGELEMANREWQRVHETGRDSQVKRLENYIKTMNEWEVTAKVRISSLETTIAGLIAQKANLQGKFDSTTAQYHDLYARFQAAAAAELDKLRHEK